MLVINRGLEMQVRSRCVAGPAHHLTNDPLYYITAKDTTIEEDAQKLLSSCISMQDLEIKIMNKHARMKIFISGCGHSFLGRVRFENITLLYVWHVRRFSICVFISAIW